ncbi:MAG: ATP-binding protein, partial [Cloacibacillus sp.]
MNATNTFSEVSSSMGEIITNFEGRLRSVKFSKNDALLPLFEAVVNSIHAIEDRNAPAKSEDFIEIKIDRVNQTTINDDEKVKENAIQTITITDNGIGFTDANLQSFKTLDSDYKSNRGGKGIGRLVWLKAFAKVEIESVYIEGDEKQHRSIIFDHKNDVTVEPPAVVVNEAPCLTKVCLKNYYAEFAPTSSIESIGIKLLEHCIGYIVGNTNIPHITIIDGGKTLDISDLFDESKTCVTCETIVIGDNEFNLSHILFSLTKEQAPRMILTADGRAVSSWKLEPLVPGLIGRVQTESGVFDYFCRVSSSFLNKRVSSERNSFDIPLERSELKDLDISMEEIKAALLVAVKTYLHEFLKENKEKAKAHIAKYVAEIAPKYRPFLGRLPEDLPFSDTASYSEMDKYLHQHQYNIECKVLNEGRKILEARDVFVPEYEVRLNEYLKDIDDIKKSDLAGYVSHRKAVIELLKKLLKLKADGKYEAEASLHALILPMKC